MSFKIVIKIQS